MHWNCQQAKTAGKSACHILAPRMVTFLNNSMADLNQQCKKLLSNLLLERFVILVTWLHTGNPWLLFGTKDYYKLTFWKCGLWLAKSRVSITVWKTWKSSRHYTPSHTPSWTVSVENLCEFNKELYFHGLVFYKLFNLSYLSRPVSMEGMFAGTFFVPSRTIPVSSNRDTVKSGPIFIV